jgi:hypothetical protein
VSKTYPEDTPEPHGKLSFASSPPVGHACSPDVAVCPFSSILVSIVGPYPLLGPPARLLHFPLGLVSGPIDLLTGPIDGRAGPLTGVMLLLGKSGGFFVLLRVFMVSVSCRFIR